jgi:peptidoglycan/xylan/chitin deacetylase (PgdA/CDA1 family)
MSSQPPENTTPAYPPRRAAATPPASAPLPGWPSGRHRQTGTQPLLAALPRLALPRVPRRAKGRRRSPDAPWAGKLSAALRSAPTPSVRHLGVVVQPLPAARRFADAARSWAFATDPTPPPATGTHRRPGTLPIESWLPTSPRRQQALLGAFVAVGLMLIMIPAQHRPTDLNAVNAADRARAPIAADKNAVHGSAADVAKQQRRTPADKNEPAPGAQPPAPGQPTVAPTAGATGAPPTSVPPTAPPESPSAAVDPRATGPAGSLRHTAGATIALTFDDGPDPVQTPKLLDLLKKNDVKATFCLVGTRAKAYPDLVRRIVAEGHALCNHSWSHSLKLGRGKPDEIRADLDDTNKAILAAVPDAAIPYFRAPGGNFTPALVGIAKELGMGSLYWAVDPRDWDQPADEDDTKHVDRVVTTVEKSVRKGSIVLSHDFDQPQTIVAYETLIPWLKDRFELSFP